MKKHKGDPYDKEKKLKFSSYGGHVPLVPLACGLIRSDRFGQK
jgi:hypothetical protein